MGKWPNSEYHGGKWLKYDRSGFNSSRPSLGSQIDHIWVIFRHDIQNWAISPLKFQTYLPDLLTWPNLGRLPTWPNYLTYPADLPIITFRIRTYDWDSQVRTGTDRQRLRHTGDRPGKTRAYQDRPRQTRTDLEYLDYLEYLGYMEYHEYSEYLERGQFHHFYDVSSDSYISRSNILPITFSQFPCLVYPKRVVCKTLGLVRLHLSFALLSRERKNPCHCAAIHFHSAQQQIFSLCCPILRHGYCWLRKS